MTQNGSANQAHRLERASYPDDQNAQRQGCVLTCSSRSVRRPQNPSRDSRWSFTTRNTNCFQIRLEHSLEMSNRRGPASVHGRAAVADFICPDNGFRGTQARKGAHVKNHMKENYRQLQATAASNRAREEESQAPKKTLYKLGQFKNVESRLFEPTKSRKAVLKESKTFVQRGDSERRMMD